MTWKAYELSMNMRHKSGSDISSNLTPASNKDSRIYSLMDDDALPEEVQQQPSCRKLTVEFGPPQSTIYRHPHELDLTNRRIREVPLELTKWPGPTTCGYLKTTLHFRCRNITWDEKRIYFRNSHQRNRWASFRPGFWSWQIRAIWTRSHFAHWAYLRRSYSKSWIYAQQVKRILMLSEPARWHWSIEDEHS